MSNPIITVEHLSKKYVLRHENKETYTTLRDVISKKVKSIVNQKSSSQRPKEEFWALKDISFEVNQGDRVGIIGRNGAGKSTLLKILSRIVTPTKGRITIEGRVASLLEVGTGFHPELTGRENIFLNGSILGMSKTEIKRKFDEIVDFAGVEKFLDTPVKRYSSGMYVRLAFAVAANLEPEILIVDEVLAVGDASFQKKCLGKMKEVANEGRTVLFVSHNMAAIKSLCNRAISIQDGRVNTIGETSEVVDLYLQSSFDSQMQSEKFYDIKEGASFQILSVRVLDSELNSRSSFECDEDIQVELRCLSNTPIPGLYGWFDLSNSEGIMVLVSDTFDILPNCFDSLPKGEHTFYLRVPKRTIGVGKYFITFSFASSQNLSGFFVERIQYMCAFEVFDNTTQRGNNRPGFLSTLIKWDEGTEDENSSSNNISYN